MKKKLEGELISIAHRVLKLKNRSETVNLQREAKKLYEQLTVLRFYEENFETLKNDISQEKLEEKLELMTFVDTFETSDLAEKVAEVTQPITMEAEIFEEKEETIEKEVITEETAVDEETKVQAAVEESLVSKSKDDQAKAAKDINKIIAEMAEEKIENKPKQSQQIAFEDLLGDSYKEPEFVRVEDTPKEVEKAADLVFDKKDEVDKATEMKIVSENELPKPEIQDVRYVSQTIEKQESKSKSLNDKLTKGISFGLNDRIAFEKKLFSGSTDDFNRVISQLNTFDSFEEASSFITDFVKPDYKNWEGKEEYETRFLEIIEKKFN